MKFYFRFSLSLVLLLGLCATAFAAENAPVPSGDLDLAATVQFGLENNPQITASKAGLQGSENSVKATVGTFLPSMSVGYGYTRLDRDPMDGTKDLFTKHLNISQPVFTGFRLLSTRQKAILAKESSDASLTNAELTIIGEVQSNFLKLLKARMDVKSAEDSVERLKSQLKVITAFYDVGLQPRVDVLQAEVELATAEQTLLTAKNNVSTQQARLNSLLNLPLDYDTSYVGELMYQPFNLGLKECLDAAYKNRPDLIIGGKSVEIARKDADIAASKFYPQVSADYDYYGKGQEFDANGGSSWSSAGSSYWTAGVNLNWDVFKGGSDYYDHKASLDNIRKVEAELETTRLNAGFEVKRALLNLNEAADRIGVARKSVEAAKESYRMAVARYQAQVGTNNDVLDAQSRLTTSEAELTQALGDYNIALSSLYVAMGEKNVDLQVN